MNPYYYENNAVIYNGECLAEMRTLPANSFDTIITDPPYGIEFMGKKWDYDVPSIEIWQECLRVLKPGGTLLCFAGSRTQHRMACNVEDAGFILKDCIMWLYGSGFPKATDISKQLDKGHERKVVGIDPARAGRLVNQTGEYTTESGWSAGNRTAEITAPATEAAKLWNGWKSHGLKPAYEPILVAMKPNDGTYANNALTHGVSGLNIDGARIPMSGEDKSMLEAKSSKNPTSNYSGSDGQKYGDYEKDIATPPHQQGRFPANIILDEVAGAMLDEQSGELGNNFRKSKGDGTGVGMFGVSGGSTQGHVDKGGASRFFYCAKASKKERNAGCEHMEEKQTIGGGGITSPQREDGSIIVSGEKGAAGKYGSAKAKASNHHPAVKPIALMESLCTLTKTPTGGIVLDPFMGSGTTGVACRNTGRMFVGIEREVEYCEIAKARISNVC